MRYPTLFAILKCDTMTGPDRIQIVLNAADAFELFQDHGVNIAAYAPPSSQEVTEALGAQTGKLFRLLGWLATTQTNVSLRIEQAYETSIEIQNVTEPTFRDTYTVAEDPAPKFSVPHGDLRFELTRVESGKKSKT